MFFLIALASDLQGTPLEVRPCAKFITLKQFLNFFFFVGAHVSAPSCLSSFT